MTSFGALFPVGTTPESAANFSSLATFAATTAGMFLGQIGGGIGGIAAAFLLDPQGGIQSLLEVIGDEGFTDLVLGAFDGMTGVFFDLLPEFQILGSFLGIDSWNMDDFNLVDSITNFFTNIVDPMNLIAMLGLDGFIPTGLIPGLDASKIISGSFPMSMITGLIDMVTGILGIGDLTEAITGLTGITDLSSITNFFGNLGGTGSGGFLPFDLNSGSFNPVTAAIQFVEEILDPTGLLALLNPFGFLSSSVIPGLDASKVTTGTFPQSIVTGLPSLSTNALGWITGFFNSATGQTATDVPLANTTEQVSLMAETLTATAASVADMIAERTGIEANSGMTASDDFERTSSTNLGGDPPWKQTYSGAGAHVLATPNGHEAGLVMSGTTLRRCIAQNTDVDTKETLTDYQMVTTVVGNTVINTSGWGSSTDAYNDLYARMNAAGTHYVRVKVTASQATLWYAAGGAEIQLGSAVSTSQSAGARFSLVAGTSSGIRRYQILKNGAVIMNYNDAGNVTSVGDTFRGWGFGMAGGTNTPSTITRVNVADTTPVDIVGTTMRVSRVATGSISKAAGDSALPNATFDTVNWITPDMTWNAATTTLTVAKSGTYQFALRIASSDALGWSEVWCPLIYVGGVLRARGGDRSGITTNGFGVPALPSDLSVGGDPLVWYCTAGSTIQPGMGCTSSQSVIGDAGGTKTYFTATRVG